MSSNLTSEAVDAFKKTFRIRSWPKELLELEQHLQEKMKPASETSELEEEFRENNNNE